MKKRKGAVLNFLLSALVIFSLIFLMLAYLNITAVLNRKKDIDQLARKYILEMETTGCLSGASRTALLQQLHDLGIEGVDLSGTTISQVQYGNPVYLYVKGNIPYHSLDAEGDDLFAFIFQEETIPIEIKKMSTAKN